MREAVGGTFLLQIVSVFLIVFIGFMAIVLKYGRVFRVKNAIVNKIEQNEGYRTEDEIKTYARSLGFDGNNVYACYQTVSKGGVSYYYYKVRVEMSFDFLGNEDLISIPVIGETRIIETGSVIPTGTNWSCDEHPKFK